VLHDILRRVLYLNQASFSQILAGGLPLGGVLKREGGLVRIMARGRALVIGDVHGDLPSLRAVLEKERIDEFLAEENVLVFLGDYVDRGLWQAETLALVLLLAREHAGKVVVLRGNHEPPPGLAPYPHDYPFKLSSKFPGFGDRMYSLSLSLFEQMPLAAVSENGVLFVHGGPPLSDPRLEPLKDPSPRVIEEVLWGDPREDVEDVEPSWRGAGFFYGRRATEEFLSKNGLRLIVRGHEPCDGYKLNHGGRVVTLFTRTGSPYWNTKAGYMILPLAEEFSVDEVEGFLRVL